MSSSQDAAILAALDDPTMYPLAGRSPIVGDGVVYLCSEDMLKVHHTYYVSAQSLAVIGDRLTERGHAEAPRFAALADELLARQVSP